MEQREPSSDMFGISEFVELKKLRIIALDVYK